MNQRSRERKPIRLRIGAGVALMLSLLLAQLSMFQGVQAQGGNIFLPLMSGNGSESSTPPPNIPEVSEDADGTINVSIPDGELPTESSRSVVSAGNGPTVTEGAEVSIHWEMFSWSTGELVESSREFGEAIAMELGNAPVPSFLQESIVGAEVGSRLMVVFEKNMADLPDYFNQDDAYVLVVDVVDGYASDMLLEVPVMPASKDGIDLGGTLFLDANENGTQDGDESGIGNVEVLLYEDNDNNNWGDGAYISRTRSDGAGNYLFPDLDPGTYTLRISSWYFNSGKPLNGLEATNQGSDPDNDVDGDNNAIQMSTSSGNPYVRTLNVMLDFHTEPTSEDGDADTNLTVDLGFKDPNSKPEPTPTTAPQGTCFPLSSTGTAITFGYENIPAGSVVLRNFQTIQNVSGSGTFSDSPGGADGTTYSYSIFNLALNINIDCGEFSVINPPTAEPPTPTPTVPPTPTPSPSSACFPVSAVPGRITFGYENIPVGSLIQRFGTGGTQTIGTINDGTGTFEDVPGPGSFSYAIQIGNDALLPCGDFDVTPTPTPTPTTPPATCALVASTGTHFQFAYENVPANSTVARNGSGIQTISGSGIFEDSPGGDDGTVYEYAVTSGGQTIAVCGSVTIENPPKLPYQCKGTGDDIFLRYAPPFERDDLPERYEFRKGNGALVVSYTGDSFKGTYQKGDQFRFIDHYANQIKIIAWSPNMQKRFYWPVKYVDIIDDKGELIGKVDCEIILSSPIALDIDGSSAVERMDGEFKLDISGNGEMETVSEWFAPTEGILIDTNVEIADGAITGQHLFGDMGGTYSDGFAKLALLDANADGQVAGAELEGLAIWTDANSNAKLDAGEMSSLASHSIVSLSTAHSNFVSAATLADGSTMMMEDLWFPVVMAPASSPSTAPVTVSTWVTVMAGMLLLGGALALYMGARWRKEVVAPTM